MHRKKKTSDQFTECIKKLDAIIMEYREKAGETKTAFARGCGVSTSLIREIELGTANPHINSLGKISKHMGMPVCELLHRIGF